MFIEMDLQKNMDTSKDNENVDDKQVKKYLRGKGVHLNVKIYYCLWTCFYYEKMSWELNKEGI